MLGIGKCMYVRQGKPFVFPFCIIANCHYCFFQSISSQNESDMNESVTLALNSLPIQEKITIAEVRTRLS